MLECHNLVLGYTQPLNHEINLKIENNQWIGIIGQNGVGKSTFLKTILGNILPYAGSLRVLDQRPGQINRCISYIPQEREINLSEQMTGISLIKSTYQGWRYGLPFISRQVKQRIEELIGLVGADLYAHQPFVTLSGGQKKRIFLAQALVNKPKILLLDEPLADLDSGAKQHFIQALQKIHHTQKLGLLIVSHDMDDISGYLDGFIHFTTDKVKYLTDISQIKEPVAYRCEPATCRCEL